MIFTIYHFHTRKVKLILNKFSELKLYCYFELNNSSLCARARAEGTALCIVRGFLGLYP